MEAAGYLATLASFRGAPTDAMVRQGAQQAVVRGEIINDGREILIETEIPRTGRGRAQVNKQRLGSQRDLLGVFRTTVFTPDDLSLIKGGPSERRRYLDDLLVATHVRHDSLRNDLDRVLRQRNTLLRQAGGRLTTEVETTLEVWDEKFVALGEALANARVDLIGQVEPVLSEAYDQVAGLSAEIELTYDAPWREPGLRDALFEARRDELRRGVTLVGPHRDDLIVTIGGMPARTHASQGEQRSIALAMRLASHQVVTNSTGTTPVLLLDDIFSELDDHRSAALLDSLPTGQTILTTTGALPAQMRPEAILQIVKGNVIGES